MAIYVSRLYKLLDLIEDSKKSSESKDRLLQYHTDHTFDKDMKGFEQYMKCPPDDLMMKFLLKPHRFRSVLEEYGLLDRYNNHTFITSLVCEHKPRIIGPGIVGLYITGLGLSKPVDILDALKDVERIISKTSNVGLRVDLAFILGYKDSF